LWPNNLAARRLLRKGGLCRNCAPKARGHGGVEAIISGEILGTPSAELGKALEGADVQVYSPYQSM